MRNLGFYAAAVIASWSGPTEGSSASQDQPPLSAADLNGQADKLRLFQPKDEFDTPSAQMSVAGRRFSIDVQPWGSNTPPVACFGYPMWSYDSANGTLYVSTGAHQLMLSTFLSKQGTITKKATPDVWAEKVHYFASDCVRTDLPSYTASNAYGAEFRIDPTLQTITAVADSVPEGATITKSFEMKAPGAEARSLVRNLRVRFSGVLADWKPGVPVACASRRDGPTAGSPYDRKFDLCLFNGHIDLIELLDVRTGRALQTFTR
jgi:hypothetical protein